MYSWICSCASFVHNHFALLVVTTQITSLWGPWVVSQHQSFDSHSLPVVRLLFAFLSFFAVLAIFRQKDPITTVQQNHICRKPGQHVQIGGGDVCGSKTSVGWKSAEKGAHPRKVSILKPPCFGGKKNKGNVQDQNNYPSGRHAKQRTSFTGHLCSKISPQQMQSERHDRGRELKTKTADTNRQSVNNLQRALPYLVDDMWTLTLLKIWRTWSVLGWIHDVAAETMAALDKTQLLTVQKHNRFIQKSQLFSLLLFMFSESILNMISPTRQQSISSLTPFLFPYVKEDKSGFGILWWHLPPMEPHTIACTFFVFFFVTCD